MNARAGLIACSLAAAHSLCLGQAPAKPAPKATQASKPAAQPSPEELAFRNNCNRCHNAPQELSSRITGTVTMHMRVRANLSAEDQRLIMHFFTP